MQTLLEPVVAGLGYELLGVELHRRAGGGLVRIYIDRGSGGAAAGEHANGITADDCERVSHQVSGVLDVENPMPGQYVLEVSSPGLDRPLFRRDHYQRFVGHRIRVRLDRPLEGRRGLCGLLRGIEEDTVILEESGVIHRVSLGSVRSARLVPD